MAEAHDVVFHATFVKPGGRSRQLKRLQKNYGAYVSWGLAFFGIIWVFLHPAITISTFELKCRGTYFSENALLVRSSDPGTNAHDLNKAQSYHSEYIRQANMPEEGCQDQCEPFIPKIKQQLERIGAEVYTQQYGDQNRTNIYGILRASPLVDGKESILLVGHYRNVGSQWRNSVSDIGIGVAMLEHLSHVQWLSKDVILLLADDGPNDAKDGYSPGVQAWLQSYHVDPFDGNALPMHAGLIRAAIAIELDNTDVMDLVAILTSGVNGQLPNLDLVNTAVTSMKQRRIPVQLDRCGTVGNPCKDVLVTIRNWVREKVRDHTPPKYIRQVRYYVNNLFGMFRFMKTVATGPSGAHAEFINYNIDSITLQVSKKQTGSGVRGISALEFINSLEVVLRAMSNIEEKLHQSFFFYLLPNDHTFVSHGEYFYAVALLVVPSFMQVLLLLSRTADMRVAFAIVAFATALCGGFLTFGLVSFVVSTEQWLYSAAMIEAIVVFIIVGILNNARLLKGSDGEAVWTHATIEKEMQAEEEDAKKENIVLYTAEERNELVEWGKIQADREGSWKSVKVAAMLLVTFSHCILGMINYPLALVCALTTAPFSLLCSRRFMRSVLTKGLSFCFLVLSCPAMTFHIARYFEMDGSLSYFIAAYHQMGLYQFPYLCLIYIPIHTLSASVWLL